jgi:hypothetical protein
MLSLTSTKLAVNVISSIGVSKVIGDIVKNNTTVLTGSQKFFVNAGGLVIGSMVVEQALNHVNRTIDNIVEWHRKETSQPEDSTTNPHTS